MGLKLLNIKEVDKYLRTYAKRVEKALVYHLEILLVEAENHAKNNAEYVDRTGNLKASIGGVLLKNGKPITYAGFNESKDLNGRGNAQGREFLDQLISKYKNGYVLIMCTGMEYAIYVEDYYNLNVLKKTELKLYNDIRVTLNSLKKTVAL